MKPFLPRYTWIEVLVAIAIALNVSRFIWASELNNAQNRFFEAIGLGGPYQYLILLPIAIFWLYSVYKDESDKLKPKGKKIVRSSVVIFAIATLFLVSVYLFTVVRGSHA